MTLAERLYGWNCWYDRLPSEWRFQIVLWPLLAVGAINMAISIALWFPFGLLVLFAILFFAAVRVPHFLGWIVPASGPTLDEAGDRRLEVAGADWLFNLNRRYDSMPELRRFWVFPVILLVAGTLNMLLTIWAGFPFGLIFLLAIFALVAMRAPYAAGLLKSPPSGSAVGVPYNREFALARPQRTPAEPNSVESAMPPASGPPVVTRLTGDSAEADKRHDSDDRGASPRK
jgi:hypothetical protein